jgi:hypothetical protein
MLFLAGMIAACLVFGGEFLKWKKFDMTKLDTFQRKISNRNRVLSTTVMKKLSFKHLRHRHSRCRNLRCR